MGVEICTSVHNWDSKRLHLKKSTKKVLFFLSEEILEFPWEIEAAVCLPYIGDWLISVALELLGHLIKNAVFLWWERFIVLGYFTEISSPHIFLTCPFLLPHLSFSFVLQFRCCVTQPLVSSGSSPKTRLLAACLLLTAPSALSLHLSSSRVVP